MPMYLLEYGIGGKKSFFSIAEGNKSFLESCLLSSFGVMPFACDINLLTVFVLMTHPHSNHKLKGPLS